MMHKVDLSVPAGVRSWLLPMDEYTTTRCCLSYPKMRRSLVSLPSAVRAGKVASHGRCWSRHWRQSCSR